MSEKRCIDRGEPVSVRRRRCPECRLKYRADAERKRRAAESGYELDDHVVFADMPVVDYTRVPIRPPDLDVVSRSRWSRSATS